MTTARYCSIGRHDACRAGYCACACHGQDIAHTPQALFAYIAKAADDWVDEALCATTKHPDDWFPEAGSRRGTPQERNSAKPAKRVCGRCNVRRECLTSALAQETRTLASGIYGGLTGAERHPAALKGMPMSQRVDILMDKFEQQRASLLTNRERRRSA